MNRATLMAEAHRGGLLAHVRANHKALAAVLPHACSLASNAAAAPTLLWGRTNPAVEAPRSAEMADRSRKAKVGTHQGALAWRRRVHDASCVLFHAVGACVLCPPTAFLFSLSF